MFEVGTTTTTAHEGDVRDIEGRPLGEQHFVPADLASIPPGPYLAAVLSSIDRSKLSGHDLVLVLQAHDRLVSHFQAARLADMAEVVHASPGTSANEYTRAQERFFSASWEVRAALGLTRRAADSQLDLAMELRERFPRVLDWLSQGLIDLPRLRVIVSGLCHLPDKTAERVLDEIEDRLSRLTTGQLAALIRRLCVEADPDQAERRYQESLADRRVATEANVEGTANMYGMELEPHRVSAAMRRIDRMARDLKTASEPRTMDQLRADIFIDLLLGKGESTASSGPRGVVDITVDLPTLLELNDKPGEIGGYGPVIADIARQVTEMQIDSRWRWTLTDEEGVVVGNGTTRRRPTAANRRYVEARNPTCLFPGCRAPATQCEIDHNHPWGRGGRTHPENEGPLCRHDNVGKEHGWKLRRLRPGVYEWTSPLGHTYISESRRPP